MIPKIIHYVWIGGNEKPASVLHCIDSWKKYAPESEGYKYIEWDEKCLIKYNCRYIKEAYESKKWAFVSDYIRLCVLYEYGGIYLDTDQELTASLDGFLNLDFFACSEVYNENYGQFSTSLIGAKEHLSLLEHMIKSYAKQSYYDFKNYTINQRFVWQIENIYNIKLPNYEDKTIYLEPTVVIFPSYYFCKPQNNKNNFGIHHFDGSWLPIYRRTNLFSFSKYIVCKIKYIHGDKKQLPIESNEKLIFIYKYKRNKFLLILKVL